MKEFSQSPNDRLDYTLNWVKELGSGPLISSTWTADPGLTLSSAGFSGTTSQVWISGGRPSQSYIVRNKVSTASRTQERSFKINIEERSI